MRVREVGALAGRSWSAKKAMRPTHELQTLISQKSQSKQRIESKWSPLFITPITVALTVLLYMGLWRGIWFDELLHFAFGGMSFEYAIKAIDYSTIRVNHGQTGAYFLLDWALLHVFGASAIALRAPSWISAIFMLTAAITFLKAKGFSWHWQLLAVLSLGANETLMFFAGEARPYMPMAASALAMLAFYSLGAVERRRWWGRSLAIFGFLFGSIIHPYWAVFWILVAGFSLIVGWKDHSFQRTWRGVLLFVAPAYVLPSIILYVGVALLTWLRRFLRFGWPDSTYDWSLLTNSFLQNHFSFAPYLYPWRSGTSTFDAGIAIVIGTAFLVAVTALWLIFLPRTRNQRLLAPTLLFAAAGLSSVFFSYLSYRSEYLIFERQWLGGMALASVASTWFFAEWWRRCRSLQPVAIAPSIAFVGLVMVSFALSVVSQLNITMDRYEAWQEMRNDTRSMDELIAAAGVSESFMYEPQNPTEGYGYLANINVIRGGPVWEVFVAWLNKESGMRQEFRGQDPNWSDVIWSQPSKESGLCLPELQWQCVEERQ